MQDSVSQINSWECYLIGFICPGLFMSDTELLLVACSLISYISDPLAIFFF